MDDPTRSLTDVSTVTCRLPGLEMFLRTLNSIVSKSAAVARVKCRITR